MPTCVPSGEASQKQRHPLHRHEKAGDEVTFTLILNEMRRDLIPRYLKQGVSIGGLAWLCPAFSGACLAYLQFSGCVIPLDELVVPELLEEPDAPEPEVPVEPEELEPLSTSEQPLLPGRPVPLLDPPPDAPPGAPVVPAPPPVPEPEPLDPDVPVPEEPPVAPPPAPPLPPED